LSSQLDSGSVEANIFPLSATPVSHFEMADLNGTDEGSRFRVNRINSSQLPNPFYRIGGTGVQGTIPEDQEMTNIVSIQQQPPQRQQRSASIAQGLGGGRKKSVSLPKEFDYEDGDGGGGGGGPQTVYGKSIAYYTREALPKMDNYKNLQSNEICARPTMDELRSEAMYAKVSCFPTFFSLLLPTIKRNENDILLILTHSARSSES